MTIRPATSSSSCSSLSVSGVAGLGATSTAAGICLLGRSPRPISNLAKRLNKSVCSACRRRSSCSISPDSWFLLTQNLMRETLNPVSGLTYFTRCFSLLRQVFNHLFEEISLCYIRTVVFLFCCTISFIVTLSNISIGKE